MPREFVAQIKLRRNLHSIYNICYPEKVSEFFWNSPCSSTPTEFGMPFLNASAVAMDLPTPGSACTAETQVLFGCR